jgi:hypothetical protein
VTRADVRPWRRNRSGLALHGRCVRGAARRGKKRAHGPASPWASVSDFRGGAGQLLEPEAAADAFRYEATEREPELFVVLPSWGGKAPLSRRVRTPPLPATHAAVGNSWQNNRLRPSSKRRSVAATNETSCRTSGWFGAMVLSVSFFRSVSFPDAETSFTLPLL